MNSITPNPSESQETSDIVKRYIQFGNGEIHNCPICDTPVKAIHLYEKWEPEMFSLYVLPCNHRLGLWGGAPEWAKDAGITVTLITEDYIKRRARQEKLEAQARKKIATWNAKVSGKGGNRD